VRIEADRVALVAHRRIGTTAALQIERRLHALRVRAHREDQAVDLPAAHLAL